jgi:hypothetical protein
MSDRIVMIDTTKETVPECLGINGKRKKELKDFLLKCNTKDSVHMIDEILASDMLSSEKIFCVYLVGIAQKVNIDNRNKEKMGKSIDNYIR